MSYKLRARPWMCECGHETYYHNTTNYFFFILAKMNGPCTVCECPKYKAESSERRNLRSEKHE